MTQVSGQPENSREALSASARAIRFRAWHKEKHFIDGVWLIDLEHELLCFTNHNQDDLKSYILMQFTGLKDKNGVEIFEGDIVRWINDDVEKSQVDTVFWHPRLYGWVIGESEEMWDWLYLLLEVEVIGNIHENPELSAGAK